MNTRPPELRRYVRTEHTVPRSLLRKIINNYRWSLNEVADAYYQYEEWNEKQRLEYLKRTKVGNDLLEELESHVYYNKRRSRKS